MGIGFSRPPPFPPGTPLSEHYSVEGLVRLCEGRMFYLVNDDRPDRPRRFCWDCGSDETPRARTACVSCEADLSPRRFLVSVRWDRDAYDSYSRFFERHYDHPGLVPPIDVFYHNGVLCSVTPWAPEPRESLLIDEGAPLPMERVLDMAQRATGILAFLHSHGVSLSTLNQANFLVRNDSEVLLFDPDVADVVEGQVQNGAALVGVQKLGSILRRFTPVTARELQDFFMGAEAGKFPTPLDFGRALEPILDGLDDWKEQLGNGAMTDVGLQRVLNEDNWGWMRLGEDIYLYVVADGMGGHESGEIASQTAVDRICRTARDGLAKLGGDATPEALESILDDAFQAANNAIKDMSERMGNDMGTTLVAALIYKNELALVANVGDSRAYLMRNSVLHQITRDHSLVARMVEQNRITPEEARHHPHSNILLRTVGTERNVDIDIFRVELEKDDRLLLCSDGLWGEVDDEDIEVILNHYPDPRVTCRELIRAAHHGGGKDNITVLIVLMPEK